MGVTIDVVIGFKGGIGKTFITQILCERRANFSEQQPVEVNLEDSLWPEKFQALITDILALLDRQKRSMVVDCGQCGFPLVAFMEESGFIRELISREHPARIHVPICGGSLQDITARHADMVRVSLPDAHLVLWQNPYFGPVDIEQSYPQLVQSSAAIVTLPTLSDTEDYDLQKMLARDITFSAAIEDPGINLLARQRLVQIWRSIVSSMDLARL